MIRALTGGACAALLAAAPVQADVLTGGLAREARMYRDDGLKAQQAGDIHDAIAKYQKAALLDPRYAAVYNDLGVGYEAIGQFQDAKQAYLQCLDLDPHYVSAYANLAMLHERQGDFGTALVYWQRRVESGNPKDPWTMKAKERIAELISKPTAESLTPLSAEQAASVPASARGRPALPAAARPVEPGPPLRKSSTELEIDVGRLSQELAKSYYDLGVAYTELKIYSKAIDAFEKCLAYNPLHAQAHAHLGLLYKHVENNPEKASRHLKTYLELNPNAKDREQLESLIALLQRPGPPAHPAQVPDGSAWGFE